jgi:hypothetical protein
VEVGVAGMLLGVKLPYMIRMWWSIGRSLRVMGKLLILVRKKNCIKSSSNSMRCSPQAPWNKPLYKEKA